VRDVCTVCLLYSRQGPQVEADRELEPAREREQFGDAGIELYLPQEEPCEAGRRVVRDRARNRGSRGRDRDRDEEQRVDEQPAAFTTDDVLVRAGCRERREGVERILTDSGADVASLLRIEATTRRLPPNGSREQAAEGDRRLDDRDSEESAPDRRRLPARETRPGGREGKRTGEGEHARTERLQRMTSAEDHRQGSAERGADQRAHRGRDARESPSDQDPDAKTHEKKTREDHSPASEA
jgi:hypothetical protein